MSSAQADDGQLWRQFHGSWQDWKQLIMEVPLLALLLLSITLWWYVTQYLAPKKPPGPWPWPIVGNLLNISWSKKLPHQTLQDLAAKYGGFMYLRLGMQVITSVCIYFTKTYVNMCVDCEGGNSPHSMWLGVLNHLKCFWWKGELLSHETWGGTCLSQKRVSSGIHCCHFVAETEKHDTFRSRWCSWNKLQAIFFWISGHHHPEIYLKL